MIDSAYPTAAKHHCLIIALTSLLIFGIFYDGKDISGHCGKFVKKINSPLRTRRFTLIGVHIDLLLLGLN